ncbi:bifunctional 2-polyprenyl-6-hydroxyphenol methylase/3-demethylubiquinol 3-O-methyltransferase UbiG [Kiloniella sp. EL199]|uniref:class I SAM-dependent methyltransferase n=1 Tax=Kiloniella sp. EL199 TaxID=2107581 RepID=UPI000EA2452F|nr:class I SAM-dependent methyltransferase [Kiloniella sp. EL199]
MSGEYNNEFYDDLEGTQIPSANVIVPLLYNILKPSSVVDVGCGRGFWLKEFAKLGVQRVFGVDGPWVPQNKLAIPQENFKVCDLSKELNLPENFDLAINLEVAEHLPEERAVSFVRDICQIAPAVFLGAAIPGQGGVNHYNEQWPAYWAKLFEDNGYTAFDIIRPKVWKNSDVTWWYKQNAVVYVKNTYLDKLEGLKNYTPVKSSDLADLIHPDLFRQKLKEARPGFGRWIRGGKKALCRSLTR